MAEFFAARMVHIYLVYGLGFFTLGLATALEVGRTSEPHFARAMRALAAFGFIHGFHEWVEMFDLVGRAAYGFLPPAWWNWGRLAMLAASFAALAAFGIQMLYTTDSRPAAGLWGTLGMLTLYAAGVVALGAHLSDDTTAWQQAADAWTRYSLGVPGALLAAAGMQYEYRLLYDSGLGPFARSFRWAAIVFAIYGLLGQTIAPHSVLFPSTILNSDRFLEWFGFPIQVLRSVLAALMALYVIRGLRAFEVERRRRLQTAQRQAQEATARRDALRGELLRRTVAAQEDERARLARELHDDTLQVLTGLSAGLTGTGQLLDSNPARARAQLDQLSAMTSHAIDELRRLILNLRPSVLDDMGLPAAIRWYADAIADRLPAEVEISASGLQERLPMPVETILFRIAQEGMTNVARHAQAKRVAVRLDCDGQIARLDIEDDGLGFDLSLSEPTPDRRGWGLTGIRERVALVGGTFKVDSAPGAGTTLRVAVPKAADVQGEPGG